MHWPDITGLHRPSRALETAHVLKLFAHVFPRRRVVICDDWVEYQLVSPRRALRHRDVRPRLESL